MKKRGTRRKARKAKRRKGSIARPATRFDEHIHMARRIAKKLGKKVAKLTRKRKRTK